MKSLLKLLVLLLGMVAPLFAQMTVSHTATSSAKPAEPTAKPVARVNGTVLTDRDLVREMYAIFPYARQHNGGFPKAMEADIRKGALKMIVFEELAYQEAQRRGLAVPPAKMNRALADFRKQFKNPNEFRQYMKIECHDSEKELRAKIRRSLLIDQLQDLEVSNRSSVSLADAKAYYDKNLDQFRVPETFAIQTISIMPPEKANAVQLNELRKRAEDALRQAKATKDYETFGVLAEKISEDDYRVMMGDRRAVDRAKLPPEVLKTVEAMQPGQVSELVSIEDGYTIVRLNAHKPASLRTFTEVKDELRKQLKQQKSEQLRAVLDKKLRSSAKVEEL
jgi:parvulin-like peptidyl-prolyl isomerase